MKKRCTALTVLAISLALTICLSPARAADEATPTNAAVTVGTATNIPATSAPPAVTATPAAAPAEPAIAVVPPASPQPAIFGDNMVLQQKQKVPVWGWSKPGTEVTVRFAGQVRRAKADADGSWEVTLKPLKASAQPADLVIEAGEIRTFTNILVGEVWLCSGQSNMEKPLGNQSGQKPVFNAEQELAASDFPEIRLFKVEKFLAAEPRKDWRHPISRKSGCSKLKNSSPPNRGKISKRSPAGSRAIPIRSKPSSSPPPGTFSDAKSIPG
jgi:hypothetical protein